MVNAFLYSTKLNYIVCYSAKSGCSTVRKIFLDLHINELEKMPSDGIHNLPQYFPLSPSCNKSSIPCIIVVRNPFSRVVSMFLDKYINNGTIMQKAINLGIEITNNSFTFFLYILLELKKANLLNSLDDHIYEQTHSVKSIDNMHIVKLENFNEDFLNAYISIFPNNYDNILTKLNILLLNNPKYNRTNYNLNLKENVYHKEFLKKENIPSYEYFYNNICKNLVLEIYNKDFEMFGYSKDIL